MGRIRREIDRDVVRGPNYRMPVYLIEACLVKYRRYRDIGLCEVSAVNEPATVADAVTDLISNVAKFHSGWPPALL